VVLTKQPGKKSEEYKKHPGHRVGNRSSATQPLEEAALDGLERSSEVQQTLSTPTQGDKVAHATINLTLEFDVVNANLEPLESDSPEWEEAQDVCIEAAMDKLHDALSNLDFSASVERD
jgi:hypothetical protein